MYLSGNSTTDFRLVDYNNDNKCDIFLFSGGSNALITNQNSFGSFSSSGFSTTYPGGTVTAAEAADLNGDGTKEIITLQGNYLKIGNYSYPTASSPVALALSDMDNDGYVDIVVLNNGANSFSVFRNKFTIDLDSFVFYARQDFSIGSATNSTKILLADIDLDGFTDVITSNTGTSTLSLFRNTSAPGSVSFASSYNLSTLSGSKNPVLADLNKDGKMDIVIADQVSAGSVSFYINNSSSGAFNSSTFLPRKSYTTGVVPSFVATADADGDGLEDIFTAIPNGTSSKLQFFKNIYISGTFDSTSLSVFTVNSTQPYSKIYFADMNMDGKSDMVLMNQTSGSIMILANILSAFRINSNMSQAFNGDTVNIKFSSGITFNAGNVISVFLSDSTGSFTNSVNVGTKSTTSASDSVNIIIPKNLSGGNFRLRLISTSPALTSDEYGDITIAPKKKLFGLSSNVGAVGDTISINGVGLDNFNQVCFGTVDAPIISRSSSQITAKVPYGSNFKPVHLTDGNSQLTSNQNFITKNVTNSLLSSSTPFFFYDLSIKPNAFGISTATFDFDRDGDQDIAVLLSSGTILIQNNVTNNFVTAFRQMPALPGSYPGAKYIQAADLDNDGYSDIIVGTGTTLYFIKNNSQNGVIAFSNPITITTPYAIDLLQIADLNMDNKPDLIITSSGTTNYITVFLNNNTGSSPISSSSFTYLGSYSVSSAIKRIQVKDLNKDGLNDIVFVSAINQVSCLINSGSPSLVAFNSVNLLTPSPCQVLSLDDINSDGNMDIITATNSGRVLIFRNNYTSGALSAASFDTIGIYINPFSNPISTINQLILADIDFDGKNDIFLATATSGGVLTHSVYKNVFNGTTFNSSSFLAQNQLNFFYPTPGSIPEIADINLDKRPDIIFADPTYGLSIKQNILPILSLKSVSRFACRGKTMDVSYRASNGVFNSGNVFSIQLSDSAGSFNNPQVIGSKAQTISDYVTVTIPQNLALGSNYLMRVVSSNPVFIGDTVFKLDLRFCPNNISFYPDKAEPNTIVTITGNDFNPSVADNSVYIGLAKASVVSASSTEIKIKVPPSVSYDQISLTCNGLSFTSKKYFTPVFRSTSKLDSTCLSSTIKLIGKTPEIYNTILLADFDGDGVKDLFSNTYGIVKYGYNPVTDSFSFSHTPSSVSNGYSRYVKDINGDGLIDMYGNLSLSNCPGLNVTFYLSTAPLNNYLGNYVMLESQQQYYQNTNCYAANTWMCADDFNRDGMLDFILRQTNGPDITVFNRTLSSNPNVDVPFSLTATNSTIINSTSANPIYAASADIDGDSVPDLLTESKILRNTATFGSAIISNLTPAYTYTYPFHSSSSIPTLKFADFNNDGKTDIIFYSRDYPDSLIRVMQNTGTPGSISFNNYDFYKNGIDYVGVCDFNGDGKPDIIISDLVNCFVYKNTSTLNAISFQSPVKFPIPTSPPGLRLSDVFDFNFDRRPDFIFRKDSGLYMLSNNTPTFIADLNKTGYCQDDSVYAKVSIINKIFNPGNQFILQLSDTTGNFGSPQNIGSLAATFTKQLGGRLPVAMSTGQRYRLRIVSTNPADTSFITQDSFTVYPNFTPFVVSNNSQMGICLGDSLRLQVLNPDSTLNYQWRINQSLIQGATYTWLNIKNQGMYSVMALNNVCTRITRDTFVTVYPLPAANIGISPLPVICSGDSITLKADTGIKYKYRWLLNNLSLVSDTFPNKIIKTGGTFTVIVTDSHSCVSRSRDTVINVVNKPFPAISSSKSLKMCTGDSLVLSGNAGPKLKYYWRFNGTFLQNDTLQNLKVKTAGAYSLKLADSNSCFNISTDTIVIINSRPSISMSLTKSKFCPGDSSILNVNQGLKYAFSWLKNNVVQPGDSAFSKTVKSLGIYAAIITDSNQCSSRSNDTTITVYIKIPASITAIKPLLFCNGDSAVLKGNSGSKLKYAWKKNGTLNPADTFQTMSSKSSATFSLILTDSNNCNDVSADTATVSIALPVSGFTVNKSLQCVNGNNFIFSDTSVVSAGNLTRKWNFGTGTNDTSSSQNPVKVYPGANTYPVKLVSINNTLCMDSVTKIITVYPKPNVGFTINNSSQCVNANNFTFNDTSSISAGTLTRKWNFGTGTNDTSSTINPGKIYAVAGTDTVRLVSVSNNNCRDSITMVVTVNAKPNVGFTINSPTQCLTGNNFTFSDTSTITSGTLNRKWNFSDTTFSTLPVANKSFLSANTYSVKLVSASNDNCKDSITKNVVVNPQPGATANAAGATTFCQGGNVNINANTASGLNYQWRNNNTTIAGANASAYSANTSGSYKVIVANTFGCSDTSNAVSVVVNPLPVIGTMSGKISASVNDTANYSIVQQTGFLYNWSVTNGNIQSGQGTNSINVKWTTKGPGTVKVAETTANSCSDSGSLSVTVNNAGVNEFSDNHFSIHPNPATNELIISRSNQPLKNSEFTVTDLLGRKVSEEKIINDVYEFSVSVSELKPGVYFLIIRSGDEISQLKFVKDNVPLLRSSDYFYLYSLWFFRKLQKVNKTQRV
ncbi:MAG: FG-GAP-like repeat-containing protein [Bacteroidia bacterium]